MAWAPDYLTVDEASEYLRIPAGRDDAQLEMWVSTVSRLVDQRCNRQFGRLDTAQTMTYREPAVYEPVSGLYLLAIDDVCDETGLLVNGGTLAAAGALLYPFNAALKGRPYTHLVWTSRPSLPDAVTVTSRFGWAAVPPQVTAACKLQLARLNARRDSPFGVAGSPSEGSELRLLARLDPDVAVTLAGVSRPRRAG